MKAKTDLGPDRKPRAETMQYCDESHDAKRDIARGVAQNEYKHRPGLLPVVSGNYALETARAAALLTATNPERDSR